jgi:Na+-translocating ferredoxin:NAD+ oxidoreductase RnfC subunit
MKNRFGFEVQDSRQIDLDLADDRVNTDVATTVKAWKSCIRCGNCAAVCPEGEGVYKLNLSAFEKLTGLAFEKLTGLEKCYLCGKCQLVCPRGIPTRFVIMQVMNFLKEYGKAV